MRRQKSLAVAAILVAIAVTATMDATGATIYSALPLLPIGLALWYLAGSSRRQVGLTIGPSRYYIVALLYPIVVLGICAAIPLALGAADLTRFVAGKTLANILLGAVATTLAALLTEEGFFRGALWAAVSAEASLARHTLLTTSIAFAAWHISAVTLPTGFDPPPTQIPIFLINAAVMGAIWGVLRRASGSIVVSSLSHGVWNGIAYALFGYGTKTGALGVRHTAIYGPEVGITGLALNAAVLVALLTLLEPSDARTLNKTELIATLGWKPRGL